MTAAWERRKILIWGKTRPEVSHTYRETVCTGGVFADTGNLVRLYPIPLRYMDDERYFSKYQWIEADVARAIDRDNRPESYRIRAEGLMVVGSIPTASGGDWNERATWVFQPQNLVQSVEELQARQRAHHTSLGILKPKKIVQVHVETFPPNEKRAYWSKYKEITRQMDLQLDDEPAIPKPLTPPDYRFLIRFRCDDSKCETVHKFGILDWEIDALYFNLKQQYDEGTAKQKVKETLEERATSKYDLHFFLGNISTHPTNFTIVGLWYPKKKTEAGPRPQSLGFDAL